jgi:hypothetical protein
VLSLHIGTDHKGEKQNGKACGRGRKNPAVVDIH